MFDDFVLERIDLGEIALRVRHGGSGSPLLVVHEGAPDSAGADGCATTSETLTQAISATPPRFVSPILARFQLSDR